jgi:hypothetical protein
MLITFEGKVIETCGFHHSEELRTGRRIKSNLIGQYSTSQVSF